MNLRGHGDAIEDALVAWWHARTMLEAALARLAPDTESIEHIRAQRVEATARDVLYTTMETYLSLAATSPGRLRPIDPFLIRSHAMQLAETPAKPPQPPARSVK